MEVLIWFRSMLSQFHYSNTAVTGFNYSVAYRDFDDMGLTGSVRDEWKWKMKILEAAALSHMNRAA